MGCNYWKCRRLNEESLCDETDAECLEDMCEDFQECKICNKYDGEGCPEY